MATILDSKGEVFSSSTDLSKALTTDSTALQQILSGYKPSDNVTVDSAMKQATVYGCVKIIAEGLGQLPVRLYEVDTDNKKTLVKRNHKWHKVMTLAPNDYMTWQELLEMYALHASLRGNFYCMVNRNPTTNKIVEFIPIPNPDSVVVKLINGQREFNINCTELGINGTYTSDKILHVKSVTEDGLIGLSTITQAASNLSISQKAEQFAKAFYDNDATPNLVIEMDQQLDEGGAKRLREALLDGEGLTNANKVGILEQGMKIKHLSISQKDAQFLETRAFQDTQICGLFRVPASMLGLGDNKYGSAEQLRLSFTSDALNPLITRFVQCLKKFLYEDNLEMDLDLTGFIKGDLDATGDYLTKMWNMGAFTLNQVLEFVGEPTVEGGDVRVIGTNNTTIGTLADIIMLKELASKGSLNV